MGEAAASGQKGSPNLDLAKEQEEIRNELNDLREQRYSRTGKLGDVGKIDQAGREMKEGSHDLKRDQPRKPNHMVIWLRMLLGRQFRR